MTKSTIYTRTGDRGETSLVSGTRISKANLRISLYGDVDELNSHIGYLRTLLPRAEKLNSLNGFFDSVQSSLFDLGSKLACESELWDKYQLPNIKAALVTDMEKYIDEFDEDLPRLKNFILPGGCPAGAYAHIVRTVCRKVERKLIDFGENNQAIPENSIIFLNRLSDFMFIFSRSINHSEGMSETIWMKS